MKEPTHVLDEKEIKSAISGKKVLVTGGTGSFGHEILRELIKFNPASILVFSRDEKKQHDMRLAYSDYKYIDFMIGDVRNADRVREAMRGKQIVFHAAALKQVPSCEKAPFEAVLTNINGAENVRLAALGANVETVVSVSTDKAVKPVNVMGMSKAIQERIMQQTSDTSGTKFVCVRYGNVLGSRGSIVPLFVERILAGQPLPITHEEMTRFQLSLSEAVKLVFWATVRGSSGDMWVKKMPSIKVTEMGQYLAHGLTGCESYPTEIIGTRPGEKLHEVLVSEEEMWRAVEYPGHFLIPSWRESFDTNLAQSPNFTEYSSSSVDFLDKEAFLTMLRDDGWIAESGFGPGKKVGHYG
ncbi:UDP-glucose 4-epimerase [compost metagenome]